jgi:hypothetical protein
MRTSTVPLIEPTVVLEHVTTPEAAKTALLAFTRVNGHSDEAVKDALAMFRDVVHADGDMTVIWHHYDEDGRPGHNAYEDIAASPTASDLVNVIIDARPGLRYYTEELPDACGSRSCCN